jgi:hypothetical protein
LFIDEQDERQNEEEQTLQLQRVCLDAGKFSIFVFRLFFLLREHAVKSGHGALQARAESLIRLLRCS